METGQCKNLGSWQQTKNQLQSVDSREPSRIPEKFDFISRGEVPSDLSNPFEASEAIKVLFIKKTPTESKQRERERGGARDGTMERRDPIKI